MRSVGRTSTHRDRITTGTLRRRHSVRDSFVAMTRDIGSMPVMETAATATLAAEREAFLGISLGDLESARDKVISNLKCRADKAWHFFFCSCPTSPATPIYCDKVVSCYR